MKNKSFLKKLMKRVEMMKSLPEIPDLGENSSQCCPNCQSELISVTGVVSHVDLTTGDVFLPVECATCGDPGFVQYSMVKCVNSITAEAQGKAGMTLKMTSNKECVYYG